MPDLFILDTVIWGAIATFAALVIYFVTMMVRRE